MLCFIWQNEQLFIVNIHSHFAPCFCVFLQNGWKEDLLAAQKLCWFLKSGLDKCGFMHIFKLCGYCNSKQYIDSTKYLKVTVWSLRVSVNGLLLFVRYRMLKLSEKFCWGAHESQQEKQQQNLGFLDDLCSAFLKKDMHLYP